MLNKASIAQSPIRHAPSSSLPPSMSVCVCLWLITTHIVPLTYICPTCVSHYRLTLIPTDPLTSRQWRESLAQHQQEASKIFLFQSFKFCWLQEEKSE